MTALLILFGIPALVGAVGAIVVTARDGYRHVPTRTTARLP